MTERRVAAATRGRAGLSGLPAAGIETCTLERTAVAVRLPFRHAGVRMVVEGAWTGRVEADHAIPYGMVRRS